MDDLEELLHKLPKDDLLELTKFMSQAAVNHSLDMTKGMDEEVVRQKLLDGTLNEEAKRSFNAIFEPTLRRWLRAKGYAIEIKG